jgi:rhodanese-related sulfurtransferase
MGLFDFFRTADINEGVAEYRATDGAVLLDVRTAEEYRNGHIDGSINLPLNRIHQIENIIKDKSTPLYVHCYSGSRSGQAVSYLKRMGYINALNIGGISSYRKKEVK